jgi:type II secretory pathway pseudopilin PulG
MTTVIVVVGIVVLISLAIIIGMSLDAESQRAASRRIAMERRELRARQTARPFGPEVQELEVLSAFSPGVAYDLTQLSSASSLPPSEVKRAVGTLLLKGRIKPAGSSDGGQRYRLADEQER